METLIYSKKVRASQFFTDITNEKNVISVNGNPMNRGYYNLILSKRDFGLFAIGLKISRGWKFNVTKKYFGITGNAEKAAENISRLLDEINAFLGDKKEYKI